MRYEHSRVEPNARVPRSRINSVVNVRSSGVLPLHLACLVSSATICSAFDFAGWLGYMPSDFTLFAAFYALTPAVIVTCIVYTLCRGDFKQWWQYTEVYAKASICSEDPGADLLIGGIPTLTGTSHLRLMRMVTKPRRRRLRSHKRYSRRKRCRCRMIENRKHRLAIPSFSA